MINFNLEHFAISDRWIGLLSASIFAGMMVGAWGWGSCEFDSSGKLQSRDRISSLATDSRILPCTDSDTNGRKLAFNSTLLITSICGIASAFAPTFGLLCLGLFGLGTGVGGSMPTDGTL